MRRKSRLGDRSDRSEAWILQPYGSATSQGRSQEDDALGARVKFAAAVNADGYPIVDTGVFTIAIQPCRLFVPDDLFNSSRCIHRVKTVRCLNARDMMTPTKNDSSAISTHASSVNAKDKRSIG
jgi:hypothetical protein